MNTTRVFGTFALAGVVACGLFFAAARAGADDPSAQTSSPAKEKTMDTKDPKDSRNGMAVCEADFDALKMFKAEEGVWDMDITLWFRPGAEPVHTKAVCTAKLILNGMYLEQVIDGGDLGPKMPNSKWSSRSYTGFNATTRQLETVRLSSTMSNLIVVKGGYDSVSKTSDLSGEYMFMNAKATSRDVTTIVGDDERRIDSYMSFAGSPEFKGASMIMKRRK